MNFKGWILTPEGAAIVAIVATLATVAARERRSVAGVAGIARVAGGTGSKNAFFSEAPPCDRLAKSDVFSSQLKAILAAEIIKTLDKKGVSVRKAQSLTGIDAGDFSRVRNADFRRISVERLMAMINGLGSRVEVAAKISRAQVRHAAVAP